MSTASLADEELRLAVYESLRATPFLRYTNVRFTPFRLVEVDAHDGVVRLSGYVANELHRREAVRRVAATPGVRRVEDQLVTDEQLQDAVARAMLAHRELQPSRVKVTATLGKVVLEGELDSPRDVELATAIAASVPGVTSVESRLRVVERQSRPPPAALSEPRLVLVEFSKPRPPWRYAGVRPLKPRAASSEPPGPPGSG